MARSTRHWLGRLTALTGAATLAVSALISLATPAAAATAPPWHWTEVTGTASLTWFSSQTVALSCPSGLVPISGGFVATEGGLRLKGQHADLGSNQYVFTFGNSTGTTQTAGISAWCVPSTEIGTITTATTTNNIGAANPRTGTRTNCPDPNPGDGYSPYLAIGADVEWASTGSRTIDFLAPDTSVSWTAKGSSTTSGDVLSLTVRCVPSSFAMSRGVGSANVTAGSHTVTATCDPGTRVLNGGAEPEEVSDGFADHGYMWASSATRTTWTASVKSVGSDKVYVLMYCIKTNVPTVTLTAVPPSRSNTTTGQFGFSVSEPFGQSITTSCSVDGAALPCTSGQASYGPLAQGSHQFTVDAVNQDGEHAVLNYGWTIDLTPPAVTSTSPGPDAAVGATFDAVFSEVVSGIDASSFQVHDDGGQPIAGTVTSGTASTDNCYGPCVSTAGFTPSVPLSGHRGYTASLTTGIHDAAGNPIAPTSWDVTTANGVPNCAPVTTATDVNTSTPMSLTCSDPDSDALSYVLVTPPSHGQVTTPDASGGSTYTPDAGYVGPDSFTFQATDGYGGTSPTATASVNVGPDHAPVCVDVSKAVGYETPAPVPLSCTDSDTGQQLAYVVDSLPAHGGVGTVGSDGSVTYTPYPGYTGQDSFTYHANDGYGAVSAVKTVTLYVATDAPPTCVSKSVSVLHATAVSIPLACTDPDTGQTLTLFIATSPSHGSLSMTDPTHVTYKPSSTFGGTDSFTYKASDGQGGQSAAATVTLKVAPGATVLTLKAATLNLAKGKTDRLTGRLRDKVTGAYVNGRTVLLQVRSWTSTSWSTLARTATARVGTSNGVARFSVQPRRSCYYRVVFRATAAYRASTSSAVHIRVT